MGILFSCRQTQKQPHLMTSFYLHSGCFSWNLAKLGLSENGQCRSIQIHWWSFSIIFPIRRPWQFFFTAHFQSLTPCGLSGKAPLGASNKSWNVIDEWWSLPSNRRSGCSTQYNAINFINQGVAYVQTQATERVDGVWLIRKKHVHVEWRAVWLLFLHFTWFHHEVGSYRSLKVAFGSRNTQNNTSISLYTTPRMRVPWLKQLQGFRVFRTSPCCLEKMKHLRPKKSEFKFKSQCIHGFLAADMRWSPKQSCGWVSHSKLLRQSLVALLGLVSIEQPTQKLYPSDPTMFFQLISTPWGLGEEVQLLGHVTTKKPLNNVIVSLIFGLAPRLVIVQNWYRLGHSTPFPYSHVLGVSVLIYSLLYKYIYIYILIIPYIYIWRFP